AGSSRSSRAWSRCSPTRRSGAATSTRPRRPRRSPAPRKRGKTQKAKNKWRQSRRKLLHSPPSWPRSASCGARNNKRLAREQEQGESKKKKAKVKPRKGALRGAFFYSGFPLLEEEGWRAAPGWFEVKIAP